MSGRRNLSIVLGIVILVGVSSWYLTGRAPRLPRHPLGAVPRGATAALHVDVGAVLASRLWALAVVARGGDAGVRRLETLCGSDPLSHVGEVTAFATGPGPGDLERVGLVVRGRFDPGALGECVRRVVEADGGSLRQTQIAGVPAVAGRGPSRAAFIGNDGVVGGDEEVVRDVVRTLRGDLPSATSDPVLDHLWAEVGAGRDVALAAHVPEGWRGALRARLRAETDGDLNALGGIRALAAGASVRQGLDLGVILAMRDDGQAARGRGALTRLLEDALSAGGFAAALTAPMLRRLRVEHRGAEIHASIALDDAQLERAVDLIAALFSSEDGRSAPAPAPRQREPEPDQIIRRGE